VTSPVPLLRCRLIVDPATGRLRASGQRLIGSNESLPMRVGLIGYDILFVDQWRRARPGQVPACPPAWAATTAVDLRRPTAPVAWGRCSGGPIGMGVSRVAG
jgi:hypothetical protein